MNKSLDNKQKNFFEIKDATKSLENAMYDNLMWKPLIVIQVYD
jgi:hypothetical protein